MDGFGNGQNAFSPFRVAGNLQKPKRALYCPQLSPTKFFAMNRCPKCLAVLSKAESECPACAENLSQEFTATQNMLKFN